MPVQTISLLQKLHVNPAFGHLPLKLFSSCLLFFSLFFVFFAFFWLGPCFFFSVLLFDLLVAVFFHWNHNGAEPLYLTWVKKLCWTSLFEQQKHARRSGLTH